MKLERTFDLIEIRIEQATMLKQRVVASCLFVEFLICNYSVILLTTGERLGVLVWFFLSTTMVAVTYFYAKLLAKDGITRENVGAYLRGHIAISAITGALWGCFAIYVSSTMEPIDLLVSVFLVCGITIGGMLPSSAYRPGYMALAIFSLLPFSIFITVTAPWPLRLMGLAIMVYFAFGMITSARAERDMYKSIERQHDHDRAEKLKLENTLIQRVNEEKTRFLAATSHDLSQPLHAQGYFIQALRAKTTEPDQLTLLDKIEQTWQRQGQFLRGLVDINRLNSGAIKPNNSNVASHDEMQALADEFANLAIEKNIDLTCNFEEVTTLTDAVLLNRIVRNILSNAIKYTPVGGHVKFSLEHKNSTPIITVTDNGHGIPEDEIDNIFEEYVQLEKSSSNENGVGLGLSIVSKLADLLDIQLNVQSKLGHGTTFTVQLPRFDKAIEITTNLNDSQPSERELLSSSPLVMLVDDDRAVLEAMSHLMTSWGCQLITASNPFEAIDLLNNIEGIPSLIITDKWLENGACGIDLIASLREEVNVDVPAILMSGDPSGIDDEKHHHNLTFMIKPVAPDAIYARLKDVIALTQQ